MKNLVKTAAMVLAIGLVAVANVGRGQQGTGTGQGTGGTSSGTGLGPRNASASQAPALGAPSLPSLASPMDDPFQTNDPHLRERAEKMRNDDRQKKLILDTERLLSLANELKIDVDKSDKNTLSLDVIHKADEIEKLAHSVKERMRGE